MNTAKKKSEEKPRKIDAVVSILSFPLRLEVLPEPFVGTNLGDPGAMRGSEGWDDPYCCGMSKREPCHWTTAQAHAHGLSIIATCRQGGRRICAAVLLQKRAQNSKSGVPQRDDHLRLSLLEFSHQPPAVLFQTFLHNLILGRMVGKGRWRRRDGHSKLSVGVGNAFFSALAGTVGVQHVGNPGVAAKNPKRSEEFA